MTHIEFINYKTAAVDCWRVVQCNGGIACAVLVIVGFKEVECFIFAPNIPRE